VSEAVVVLEFLVAPADEGWALCCEGDTVSVHESEFAALHEADRLARVVHRDGCDARVLARGSSGRLHLERSYGRHPLVAPGGERAVSAT
jgi:hypothetical protein